VNEKQQRENAALEEQELREQDARLARLEARARDEEATDEQVKQKRDDAREQRLQVAAASEDTRSDKKNAFRRALDELKAKWQSAREKIHRAHHETQPEQHP